MKVMLLEIRSENEFNVFCTPINSLLLLLIKLTIGSNIFEPKFAKKKFEIWSFFIHAFHIAKPEEYKDESTAIKIMLFSVSP